MATTKFTVALEDYQLEEVRSLVKAGQAASVSAVVKHAIIIAYPMLPDGKRCSTRRCKKPVGH